MTFIPQRPYMPVGTLRAAVCYPSAPGGFEDAAVASALERVDLDHLVPMLDRSDRWDRQLPLDEQQRLAFARLLLHAPRWVVLDDAISALGDEHRRLVLSLKDSELAQTTLIRLGRDAVLDGVWERTLRIVERQAGPKLRADASAVGTRDYSECTVRDPDGGADESMGRSLLSGPTTRTIPRGVRLNGLGQELRSDARRGMVLSGQRRAAAGASSFAASPPRSPL